MVWNLNDSHCLVPHIDILAAAVVVLSKGQENPTELSNRSGRQR